MRAKCSAAVVVLHRLVFLGLKAKERKLSTANLGPALPRAWRCAEHVTHPAPSVLPTALWGGPSRVQCLPMRKLSTERGRNLPEATQLVRGELGFDPSSRTPPALSLQGGSECLEQKEGDQAKFLLGIKTFRSLRASGQNGEKPTSAPVTQVYTNWGETCLESNQSEALAL